MTDFGVKPAGSGQMPIVPPEIEVINKTDDLLSQLPMVPRVIGGGQQQLDELEKHFKSLSPEMKDFMYKQLTSGDGPMKQRFDGVPSKNDLLKILNAKHEGKPDAAAGGDGMQTTKETQKSIQNQQIKQLLGKVAEAAERQKLEKQLDKTLNSQGDLSPGIQDAVNTILKKKP